MVKKTNNQKKVHFNFFSRIPSIILFIFLKIKFLLRVAFLALIATIIGIVILLKSIDPNKYKNDLQKGLELTLGRKVEIDGNIEWQIISFEPAIKIGKVSIANTKWGKTKNIFEADNVSVILSLNHLLARKISIDTVLIENPKLNLEISTKNNKNWDFKTLFNTESPTLKDIGQKLKKDEETLTKAINHPKFEIAVKSVQIKNGQINFDDRKNKINEKFVLKNFFIFSENYSSPIIVDCNIEYKGGVYKASFKTFSFEEVLAQAEGIPIVGILNLNGIKVDLISKITNMNSFNSLTANINLNAPDIQKSLQNITHLPKFDSIKGDFDLILAPKILSLKKLNLTYDNLTNILGDIDIVLSQKPDIKATLRIPSFDIPKLFYPLWEPAYFERQKTGAKKPHKPEKYIENPKAFKDVPFPIRELNLANVILQLQIDKLKAMPEMPITNIKLNANLNDGRAIIAPLSFDYMGGKVFIDIIANNKNNTFNGDVSIKGTGVNVGDIVASTGYKNVFVGGNTNIDIVLKGLGKNLEEFMKNLNGYVKVYTTSDLIGYRVENLVMATDLVSSIFKFIGDDILGTITGADTTPEKSVIQCAVVNLNIQNGKTISNRGIVAMTKVANIIIDGLANLGDEYVDVSIITVVKEGLKVSNSLAEMIKIEGPMARPSIIISKDGVINNVAKTAFTTALVGTLTGGVTLITAGLGMLTKSWIQNIREDKNPCLTAFEGSADEEDSLAREEFGKQIILRETLTEQIKEEKARLNKATSSTINKTRNNAKETINSK